MPMRKSGQFLAFVLVCGVLFVIMLAHSMAARKSDELRISQKRALVKRLGLGDLCLFADARYTRHPAAADLNTPFQDYPLSLEHFPSGSLLSIPPHLQPRGSH